MINSIDITTMLPRTAEAADLQGREDSQLQHAADQHAVQFQNLARQEAAHTVEAQKSETEDIDMEDSSGGGGARSRNSKRKKKQQKRHLWHQNQTAVLILWCEKTAIAQGGKS